MSPKKLLTYQYNETESSPIGSFLKNKAQLSGRNLRQYFYKGLITINKRRAHSQALLQAGDVIKVLLPSSEHNQLVPEERPLEIVYEDEHLLVINKPALIAVHPSGPIKSGTLANQITAYYQKINLPIKVRPVNRLDYGTSGLMLIAKDAATQTALSQALQQHLIVRTYQALISGVPGTTSGTIRQGIKKAGPRRIIDPTGKSAVTHYQLLETYPQAALVQLRLETGRTHQIRLHLQHLGHPILGDGQYGKKSALISRPALHAAGLSFHSPDFAIPPLTAPLPADMQQARQQLQSL